MPTHVALLRGINVGDRNRVAMADPREVVLGLGHTEVATYIQSGDVVFTSEEADTATIAAALERAIAEHLGVQPKVIVLTRAGLDLAGELARLEQLRRQHLAVLEVLDAAGWERTSRHGEHGTMTVELYGTHVAAEEVDHLAQIARLL